MAYAQCMYARGNQVPGQMAYRAAPPGRTAPAYPPPNYPPPNLSHEAARRRGRRRPQLAPPASNFARLRHAAGSRWRRDRRCR